MNKTRSGFGRFGATCAMAVAFAVAIAPVSSASVSKPMAISQSLNSVSAVKVVDSAAKKFTKLPKPTFTGQLKVGKKLTVKHGVASPKATSYSYQWLRNNKAIKKATKKTYVLTSGDAAKKISVKVTVKRTGYTAKSSTSSAKQVAALTFKNSPKPKISGSAKIGKTLTVSTGTWSPKPSSYAYQWLKNGKAIKNETKKTYKIQTADRGAKLSVRVTAAKTGYKKTSITSATVSVPKGKFTKAPSPKISGITRYGQTLRVVPGNWSPAATSFKYQWLRGSKAISGATKQSYKLTAKDRGYKVTVRVTANRIGYTSVTKSAYEYIPYGVGTGPDEYFHGHHYVAGYGHFGQGPNYYNGTFLNFWIFDNLVIVGEGMMESEMECWSGRRNGNTAVLSYSIPQLSSEKKTIKFTSDAPYARPVLSSWKSYFGPYQKLTETQRKQVTNSVGRSPTDPYPCTGQ